MGLQADIFWSFRSPYSYLATRRYSTLAQGYDLTINLRPVYPLAIREPDFFERSHPNWLRYTFTDMFRVAQFHGIPFGPPRPDPIVQDVLTRKIAEEQPYIFRLIIPLFACFCLAYARRLLFWRSLNLINFFQIQLVVKLALHLICSYLLELLSLNGVSVFC
jgi:hypothetical protein